jgi:hypothetical protein
MNVTEPATRLDTVNKGSHGRSLEFTGFQQFRQTATHHMNVFNAAKLKFDVFIEILILVAFASGSIGHSVYLPNVILILENRSLTKNEIGR